jgi:hypothetical protein
LAWICSSNAKRIRIFDLANAQEKKQLTEDIVARLAQSFVLTRRLLLYLFQSALHEHLHRMRPAPGLVGTTAAGAWARRRL